jgi:hypothetical protein
MEYEEYRRAPIGERKAILERFIAAVGAAKDPLPASWASAKERVLPVLRARWTYEYLRLTRASVKLTAARLVTDLLMADIAFDSDNAISTVTSEQLAVWGVDAAQAHQQAEDNLRLRSTAGLRRLLPGLYSSGWGDSYGAARMLLPELFYRVEIRGSPVVMVPNRDLLLVAGHEDPEALKAMADAAKKAHDEPRPLCFAAWLRTDDGWEPYAVEESFPDLQAFRELRLTEMAQYYAEQKREIDRRHERERTDIFVAEASLATEKHGKRLFSYAVWSQGVDTLLPEAEFVIFYGEMNGKSRTLLPVPWPVATERCVSLLEPTDDWPPRWRARRFPDPTLLAELEKERVEI